MVNWNSSTSLDTNFLRNFPCIDVIPSSQVNLLKLYCLENKQNIASLLKDIGIKIDKKDYHSRIETRIDRASQEKTPWLFNYHLTEGWNAASDDLKLLQNDEHMNLVVVTVAAYQLATLDYGVNKEVILSSLKDFHNEPLWLSKVQITLEEYCHIKDGLVKNKHYEYSRRVLKIFTSQKDPKRKKEKLYLISILKKILLSPIYEKGHSNILEFIMFDFRWCQSQLNRTGFAEKLSKELFSSSKNAKTSPVKIRKLNSLIRFNKDALVFLRSNNSILEKWIFSCCRDTAYPLESLFNTLHNENYSHFPSNKLLVDSLLNKIVTSDIADKSRFSRVLNRAYLLLRDSDKTYASERLSNINFNLNISHYSANTACYQFSSMVNNLSYISPDWANQQVKNNIDGIANLLNQNLIEAYQDFNDLIDSYFGVTHAILGIKNKSSKLTKRGRELTNKIQIDAILKAFEAAEAVDIQSYSHILIFIGLYNEPKLKEVSERFNYTRLENMYKGDDKIDHYHRGMICILHHPDSASYMNYVSKVIIASDYIDELFFRLNLDLALEQLKKGVKYKMTFHDCSECKKEILILNYIMREENEALAKRILLENEQEIAKSIFNKAQNVDDKKGKFDLLIFIYINCPEMLKTIFSDQAKNTELLEKVTRLLKGKAQEKNIARLYVFLIKKYADDISPEIFDIEKRYPSVRKFDIADYFE